MAKKKQHQQQNILTPENYVKTKARTLPIIKCLLNSNWQKLGLATVIIVRQHKSGKYTLGIYLVDTFGRGLKDTFYKFNETQEYLDEVTNKYKSEIYGDLEMVEVEYSLAHNIIYGGIAFAEENNSKTTKDFNISKYILEEDDENIELIELEFGVEGKAVFTERSDFNDTEDTLLEDLEIERNIENANNTEVI